jgi:transcriptional regulator with XRE-family HTH domain
MERTERLRVLLAITGHDQKDLAREAGVSAATISRGLNGKRPLTTKTLDRVVRALVVALTDDAASAP